MIHKTKGIVLRTIKYGETSLVVHLFTALYGVQTYLVNGIRTQKKSGNKAAMYQPAAILELEVYHNDLKAMQRIKECNWGFLYEHIFSNVIKNSIALYMIELLYKTLKQPEEHSELFDFCEEALMQLDVAENAVTANFPLYFTLHLSQFLGFRISNDIKNEVGGEPVFLDLLEGNFCSVQPRHPHFLHGQHAAITSELLKIMQPAELSQIKTNHLIRKELLLKYQDYYSLHIPDFGQLKTLQVLHELFS